MSRQPSMFRTRDGEARYFAAYDATLALWPVPVESFAVPTRFGSTHINACGPRDAPPLLLLHGLGISSTMWYPNVAALSSCFRVYALDTIGDKGRSICTRPLLAAQDFVDWLFDVYAHLRLERAHVAGLSYGGFLALNLALSAPERVAKLVVLAPAACLLPFRRRFYLRLALARVLPFRLLPARLHRSVYAFPHTSRGRPAIDQFLVRTDFRADYRVFPPVYTDEQLRRIAVPTLLLIGEREIIYAARAAVARAQRLVPRIEAAVIPGVGHTLTFDQTEIVNVRILAFLRRQAGGGPFDAAEHPDAANGASRHPPD